MSLAPDGMVSAKHGDGLEDGAPSKVLGWNPWWEVKGAKPLKLTVFCLRNIQEILKI